MNKRLIIASLFLLTLIATGCTGGYESYDECLLTEMQKCSSNCKREAKAFCRDEAGKQYSKAHRDKHLLLMQKRKDCIASGNVGWECEIDLSEIDLN